MKMKNLCKEKYCQEHAYLGGLCERHYEEDKTETKARNDAIRTLHQGLIDDRPVQSEAFREELMRLRDWWSRACRAINDSRTDPLLHDEADAAISWCITLTKEIIIAERAFRTNSSHDYQNLEDVRHWVWQRFDNLSKGLMSNGIKRSTR